MSSPLKRCAPSPQRGDAPPAAGRPLRGSAGLGRASFAGCRLCCTNFPDT